MKHEGFIVGNWYIIIQLEGMCIIEQAFWIGNAK